MLQHLMVLPRCIGWLTVQALGHEGMVPRHAGGLWSALLIVCSDIALTCDVVATQRCLSPEAILECTDVSSCPRSTARLGLGHWRAISTGQHKARDTVAFVKGCKNSPQSCPHPHGAAVRKDTMGGQITPVAPLAKPGEGVSHLAGCSQDRSSK